MELDHIIGNDQVKDYIIQAVAHNKVSHAYIIEGEKGSGKKLIADAFVSLLGTGSPDVIRVTHQKPNIITVDEVREQIVNTVDIKPYKYDHKIYIIDEAEKMGLPAQNAILKTVEEPPAYGILFFLTSARGALLDTIISRCVTLQTRPVADADLMNYLIHSCYMSEEEARFITGYAMGNIGKAKMAADSESFREMRENLFSLLRDLDELTLYETVLRVKKLTAYKDQLDDLLDLVMLWYRDLLLVMSELASSLVLTGEYAGLQRQSGKISPLSVNLVFERIQEMRKRFKANVNFDASLEMLFIQMNRDFYDNI